MSVRSGHCWSIKSPCNHWVLPQNPWSGRRESNSRSQLGNLGVSKLANDVNETSSSPNFSVLEARSPLSAICGWQPAREVPLCHIRAALQSALLQLPHTPHAFAHREVVRLRMPPPPKELNGLIMLESLVLNSYIPHWNPHV